MKDPFGIRKHPVIGFFLLLHFVGCAAFIVLREPHISFLEERERARNDPERIFMSSADPIMFIAGRPLYGWNGFHGGETFGVKVLEVANLPALIATGTIGHLPIALYRATGRGSFVRDTWIRAFIFLFFSVIQWCLIGRYLERRGARYLNAA